jgi:hypothetical protein
MLRTGVSASLRRLFVPSAIFKGDFECNGDLSTVNLGLLPQPALLEILDLGY